MAQSCRQTKPTTKTETHAKLLLLIRPRLGTKLVTKILLYFDILIATLNEVQMKFTKNSFPPPSSGLGTGNTKYIFALAELKKVFNTPSIQN